MIPIMSSHRTRTYAIDENRSKTRSRLGRCAVWLSRLDLLRSGSTAPALFISGVVGAMYLYEYWPNPTLLSHMIPYGYPVDRSDHQH
jgi:hypothetical protein